MLNKTIIARNFSKCASLYDEYANIQRLAASHLIKEIPKHKFNRVLEMGCGTGIYTQLLKNRIKCNFIKAVDISDKMVKVAQNKIRDKKVVFEVGDAEKIALDEEYDLITSSSTIQWFTSLENTLKRCSGILNKGAWFIFSSFGPKTFVELAASLGKIQTSKKLSIASKNFLDKKELKSLLLKYFNKVSIKEILTQEKYPSLESLLKKIKYTGTRGYGIGNNNLWNKGLLKAVEGAYILDSRQQLRVSGLRTLRGNDKIVATYQIFLCKAEK